MDNSAENIKRELHFGNNKKLNAAFQKLLGMGYSVNDTCTILADYQEQAADEAEYIDEVKTYFNRYLRDLVNDKYDREEIDAHLYYLPSHSGIAEGFNDFMRHLADPNDELDTDEEADLFMKFKSNVYDALDKLLDKNIYNICDVNMNGYDLIEVIDYSVDALSLQMDNKAYLEEAVKLSSYVLNHFSFHLDDEYESEHLNNLLYNEAMALNELGKYPEADAVLDQMEHSMTKGEALENRLSLMMDRDEEEEKRAASIAEKVLQDRDFIKNDASSVLFLQMAEFIFDDLDEEENLEYARKLLEEKGQFNDVLDPYDADEMEEFLLSSILDAVDKAVASGKYPEVNKAKEKLRDMGFSDEEIRMAMAGALLDELETGEYEDEEDAEEASWDLLEEADANEISDDILDADISGLEEISRYDDPDAFDMDKEEKYLAEQYLSHKDIFRNSILDYIKREKDNSFQRICDVMMEDNILFEDFVQDCADALNNTEHYQETLDFIHFILDTFDFKRDDTSTEPILKELAVEVLDELGKHKEADAYIDEWMRKDTQSTRPIWAKLISLQKRGEQGKALKLADQIMKMDLPEGEDTEVLLNQVQDVYEESGDQSRIARINERLGELYGY